MLRALMLFLIIISTLLSPCFGQPIPAKRQHNATSQSLISWTALDTTETTKIRMLNPKWRNFPSPPNDFIPAISRNYFLDWLKRIGELKDEKQLQVVYKTAMVPSNAILSSWDFERAYARARTKVLDDNDIVLDYGKILDKLDDDPDKYRIMHPTTYTYKEWLGADWLTQPREKRIELIQNHIEEMWHKYSERRDIRWFETGKIVVGIAYYQHWGHIDDDPLASYELIKTLATLAVPIAIVDVKFEEKRCILLDPFECRNIPFQSREMVMDFDWGLEPVGIIKGQMVLRATDYLFLYDLDNNYFRSSMIFQRNWKELDMVLCRDNPYMITLEPQGHESSIATIWKGTWHISSNKKDKGD